MYLLPNEKYPTIFSQMRLFLFVPFSLIPQKELQELIQKYTKKVEAQLNVPIESLSSAPATTKEYQEFKADFLHKPP